MPAAQRLVLRRATVVLPTGKACHVPGGKGSFLVTFTWPVAAGGGGGVMFEFGFKRIFEITDVVSREGGQAMHGLS
jgi:hypothetical protein